MHDSGTNGLSIAVGPGVGLDVGVPGVLRHSWDRTSRRLQPSDGARVLVAIDERHGGRTAIQSRFRRASSHLHD